MIHAHQSWRYLMGLAMMLSGFGCDRKQPEIAPPDERSTAAATRILRSSAAVPSAASSSSVPVGHTLEPVMSPTQDGTRSIGEAGFPERPPNDVRYAGLKQAESDAFLATLKEAVERNDRARVASLISYPAEVRLNGVGPFVMIRSQTEFIRKYTSIMTPRVLSELRAATPETVDANWQGVSTSRGAIWFNGVCDDSKCHKYEILVTRINNHAVAGKPPQN